MCAEKGLSAERYRSPLVNKLDRVHYVRVHVFNYWLAESKTFARGLEQARLDEADALAMSWAKACAFGPSRYREAVVTATEKAGLRPPAGVPPQSFWVYNFAHQANQFFATLMARQVPIKRFPAFPYVSQDWTLAPAFEDLLSERPVTVLNYRQRLREIDEEITRRAKEAGYEKRERKIDEKGLGRQTRFLFLRLACRLSPYMIAKGYEKDVDYPAVSRDVRKLAQMIGLDWHLRT